MNPKFFEDGEKLPKPEQPVQETFQDPPGLTNRQFLEKIDFSDPNQKVSIFAMAEMKKRMEEMDRQLKKEKSALASGDAVAVQARMIELEKQIQTLHGDFQKALEREPKPVKQKSAPEAIKDPVRSPVESAQESAGDAKAFAIPEWFWRTLAAALILSAAVWGVNRNFPFLKEKASQVQPFVQEKVLQAATWISEIRQKFDRTPVQPVLSDIESDAIKVRERNIKVLNIMLYYMEQHADPAMRAKSAQLLGSWKWKEIPERLLMTARVDSSPEVVRAALTSFAAVTGYPGDRNSEAAEQWWQINKELVDKNLSE